MEKKSIKKNVLFNIVRQCGSIIFPLITYPYILRVLGAENYGKFSFADTIVGYLLLLATLGIPTYAVREGARIRDDRAKIQKLTNEIYTINILSLLVAMTMLLLLFFIHKIGTEKELYLILSLGIIFNVIGRDWVNTVFEDFEYLTIRYLLFHFLGIVLIYCFVRKADDYLLYAGIIVIINSLGYVFNFIHTRKKVAYRFCCIKDIFPHIKPIFYLFGISIMIKIYVNSDITVIGIVCGDRETGIYSLVSKVYILIRSLFNAIIMVAIPRLANLLGKDDRNGFCDLLVDLKEIVLSLLLPVVVGTFVMSDEIIQLIGGSEYIAGGTALKILSVTLLFSVFANYYANAIIVLVKKEKIFAIATAIAGLMNYILNFALIPKCGISAAALTTAISELLVMGVCRYYSNKEFDTKVAFSDIAYDFCIAILVLIGCLICKKIESPVLALSLSVVIGIVVCGIFIYVKKCKSMHQDLN